ncbi:hypothetical protein VaNZ11_015014 [Volvox africanus]|uniref:Histone-binding protein RBBP4-like N-terminal domain-containing protein n=1 Tax=Volvox africanus TaxID=51714 RepID=A0ABQ5SJN3_9CHLO|nr:hypothetical protein VaNZ11_015014 [Volvox africanus]
MIPVLYDWFMHYHLTFPTQTCRWGPKVEDLGYKTKYRAYLSEQVVDGSKPDTLILAHIDVLKPHVASCEAVSNWREKSQAPYVNIIKTVYHPGEVNKVREIPQHPEIVVTHTDSPQLYVWNMDRQPDRRPQSAGLAAAAAKARSGRDRGGGGDKSGSEPDSTPDLVLVGHEDDAPFPLACSAGAPRVGSGGNDKLVLVWDLADQITALASTSASAKHSELKSRYRLEGHTATVGDLVFQPRAKDMLISVADDGRVITWDLRGGGGKGGSYMASQLQDAHGPGVNIMCVDWNPVDENLLVTGAQDGVLQVWDRRRMSTRNDRLFTFDVHRKPTQSQSDIIHVEWHPTCKDVFASGSEDHTIAIWDLSPTRRQAAEAAAAAAVKDGAAAAAATGEGVGGGGEFGQQSSNGAVDGGSGGGGGGGGEKDKEKSAPSKKRARNSGAKDGAAAAAGAGGKAGAAAGTEEIPPQLIFRHLGHRAGRVTDFQWSPAEPWTVISVSDNSVTDEYYPDGTLQVWRMIDLLYRPYEEAIAELEQHRNFILHGITPAATTTSSPTVQANQVSDVKQEAAAS